MISFYPGPSQVFKEIPDYVTSAYESGILCENHRSEHFMKLYKSTVKLLRKRLGVPEDYTVIFVSSATESWEVIAQSLIRKVSYHFFNGAFGQKWYSYTRKLRPLAIGYRFGENILLDPENLDLSGAEDGVICITQNETSNGTQVANEQIALFRDRFPETLIAVDATSSMGGIVLDFENADVWYASVQKCFGLPAGMGVMLVSPTAIQQAQEIGDRNHYNSLLFMLENAAKWQTHYTPNILAIYLLNQVLRNGKRIDKINKRLVKRQQSFTSMLNSFPGWNFLTETERVRSTTVIAIEGDAKLIKQLKVSARKSGLILGNGYGEHAKTTFRIANFPATTRSDWKLLRDFLKKNL